jgi:hypothetical protein
MDVSAVRIGAGEEAYRNFAGLGLDLTNSLGLVLHEFEIRRQD